MYFGLTQVKRGLYQHTLFLSAHLTTPIFFICLCLLLLSVPLICTVCMYNNYIKALLVTFLRSLFFQDF